MPRIAVNGISLHYDEMGAFFLADQKDFSIKLEFEEVFNNDSGEVVGVLRNADHDH